MEIFGLLGIETLVSVTPMLGRKTGHITEHLKNDANMLFLNAILKTFPGKYCFS